MCNSRWPITVSGPVIPEDYEDDATVYDIEDRCEIAAHRPWSQPNLPFKTNTLSDGSEVPK